jgi:hypothetical protein
MLEDKSSYAYFANCEAIKKSWGNVPTQNPQVLSVLTIKRLIPIQAIATPTKAAELLQECGEAARKPSAVCRRHKRR